MKHSLLSLLLFVWCLCATSTSWAKRTVYAIAVGNNRPPAADPSLRPLRYADDDAARSYELFARFADRAELLTVLDSGTQRRYPKLASKARPPSLAELRRILEEYRGRMTADVERGDTPALYLSFSGHGALEVNGEYALSFIDGGLTQQILYDDVLAQLEGFSVHLLVDACHAAGVVGVKGAFDRELDAKAIELTESTRSSLLEHRTLGRFPYVGAIVATSDTEESHEWSRIESGVFTHEVLSGLSGAADVNRDYRIEYSELQAFVSAANQGLPAGAAKPTVIAVPPAANQREPLLDLLELRESLLLAGVGPSLGHFYVESASGQRLLDANLEPSQFMMLALPRNVGRLYIRSGSREAAIPSRGQVRLAQLKFSARSEVARGSVQGALQHGLFASSYGAGYYRGYVDSQSLVPVVFGPPRALPEPSTLELDTSPIRTEPMTAPTPATPIDRPNRASSGSVWGARGLAIGAGVAFATSAVLGYLALDRRRSFERTDKQRQAHELAEEYENYGTASLISAAVGLGAGIGAVYLWPNTQLSPAATGSHAGLGVLLRSKF